jgi:hypothetical protein
MGFGQIVQVGFQSKREPVDFSPIGHTFMHLLHSMKMLGLGLLYVIDYRLCFLAHFSMISVTFPSMAAILTTTPEMLSVT